MKKLLGIAVLGLLWSNMSIAEVLNFECTIDERFKTSDLKIDTSTKSIEHLYEYRDNYWNNVVSKRKGDWKKKFIFRSKIEYIDDYRIEYSSTNSGKTYLLVFNYNTDGKIYNSELGVLNNCRNLNIANKPKKEQKPKSNTDDNKIVPAGSGSGFFVSKDGHAITNYHVIEGCDINKLSFKGSQTEVKVLAVDKVNDIAILKSNEKPDVIFPVSNEDVSLLEDVIVAGFPLGKQISSAIKTHKGVVTALAGAGDNYSFFQTDAAINQGNSGGPIINQKGNVVGIAVATWVEEGVQGVHFGIKSSTLKTFASANGLSFASPNFRDQSNKALGELITKGTVYVECHMTVAKIKKMIAQAENRKAFFKEHK